MEQENKTAKEKAQDFVRILEAGRKLGLIYRFDAITILKKYAADMKSAGSNGKSKGFQLSAEVISKLPGVDAERVTRCERCTSYQDGVCQKYHTSMNTDDYCSRPDKRVIGEAVEEKQAAE